MKCHWLQNTHSVSLNLNCSLVLLPPNEDLTPYMHRLFLPSDETIVSVVDRNGISDKYGTLAAGKFSEVPLVSSTRVRLSFFSPCGDSFCMGNGFPV